MSRPDMDLVPINRSIQDQIAIERFRTIERGIQRGVFESGEAGINAYLTASIGFYRAIGRYGEEQNMIWGPLADRDETILNGSVIGKKNFCGNMMREAADKYRTFKRAAVI